jgi:hypothetical protein
VPGAYREHILVVLRMRFAGKEGMMQDDWVGDLDRSLNSASFNAAEQLVWVR